MRKRFERAWVSEEERDGRVWVSAEERGERVWVSEEEGGGRPFQLRSRPHHQFRDREQFL